MNADLKSRTHQFSETYQIMTAFDEKQQFKGYQQSRHISEQSKESIYHLSGESRFTEKDKNALSENSLYNLKVGKIRKE